MSPRLSELPVGAAGVVVRVSGARPVRRRLMELGLVPGTRVAVVNVAPLGDPLELDVRGCKLSIRHHEAAEIELEDSPDAPPRKRLQVRQ